MSVHNADIARVFDEIADLLELESGNPLRVRAYRDAARLRSLPGFGVKTEQKLLEAVRAQLGKARRCTTSPARRRTTSRSASSGRRAG